MPGMIGELRRVLVRGRGVALSFCVLVPRNSEGEESGFQRLRPVACPCCCQRGARNPLLRWASREVGPSAMAKGQTAPLLSHGAIGTAPAKIANCAFALARADRAWGWERTFVAALCRTGDERHARAQLTLVAAAKDLVTNWPVVSQGSTTSHPRRRLPRPREGATTWRREW